MSTILLPNSVILLCLIMFHRMEQMIHHHTPSTQEEASRLASQGLHPRQLSSIAQATAAAFCDAMLAVLSHESGGLVPQHATKSPCL